jgi:hypothetical protein
MAKTYPVARADGRVVRVTVPGAGEAPAAPPYMADCGTVQDFLAAWHEAGRAAFTRDYIALDYDAAEPKQATDRRKFIALDRCRGGTYHREGVYLLEKATGLVWTVSGYGRPNRRHAPPRPAHGGPPGVGLADAGVV